MEANSGSGEPSAGDIDLFSGGSGSIDIIWNTLTDTWATFLTYLPNMVAALAVLLVTWGLSNLGDYLLRRYLVKIRIRSSLNQLFRQLIYTAIWLTGIIVAAIVLFPGMTVGKIITVLGLSSVAIGFAFKDIFENFFAGILILWRFPFDPGNYIECEDILGKVEEITIRMTKIRKVDGELVVVPNSLLFKNPVYVLDSWDTRRTTVICGIAYGEDVDEGREVIHKAVEACATVNKEKDVEIFAQEFASSSINYEVTWWTKPTPLEVRKSKDEVVAAVKRALDNAGIEIPFPYRTLTFKEPLQTAMLEQGSGEENS
ncbi:Potassium efflux system KefA protein / Small-conductance mechanosensitive channel [Planctomycetales bacterium 10988]|nr:Potassium efflux system KefA protein / Small-conductance mechanosensitive channel [Planctomycetales bacterium 10988]